ncbi:hypothetical protein EG829_21735, partial [bacterium]|nr:hypothetical protein [bacterium]
MRGFDYKEEREGVTLKLSGNRAVLRGKKIAGFRSTLLKTTHIDNLAGDWSSRRQRISFPAESGDWDTSRDGAREL